MDRAGETQPGSNTSVRIVIKGDDLEVVPGPKKDDGKRLESLDDPSVGTVREPPRGVGPGDADEVGGKI